MHPEEIPLAGKKNLIILMNRSTGHVPIRTCVSCRSKKAKMDLVRLVISKDDRIVVDKFKKDNGRGIYLCNDTSCMDKFLKNRGHGRFFKTDKNVKPGF
jgi:predicted RNA-binding protein YlxR (DUF448 family)